MNPPIRYSPTTFARFNWFALAVAANAILPSGNLAAKDANGNAVLAADTAGLTIAGVAFGNGATPLHPNDVTMDATDTPAGMLKVCVVVGIFRFRNSATSPVTAAQLGRPVYVQDEQTVAETTANSVVAGVAVGLEGAAHIWLCVGPVGTLPGAPTLGSV